MEVRQGEQKRLFLCQFTHALEEALAVPPAHPRVHDERGILTYDDTDVRDEIDPLVRKHPDALSNLLRGNLRE
jgi:hypothetical protein